MALKGEFSKRTSVKLTTAGLYSFTLTNTGWLGSETLDCMLSDEGMTEPHVIRGLRLKAGEAAVFNEETCRWMWCQGDFFAILGSRDKIEKKWQLRLKAYRPGECPECRGSRRCQGCRGEGVMFNTYAGLSICSRCGGSGVCTTCDIPTRTPHSASGTPHSHRPPAVIQNEINDVQRQIDNIEWGWKMRDIGHSPDVGYALQMEEARLKSALQKRLITLQDELSRAY
ncbi:MAG: hypothetical protein IJ760_07065 [Bacteroidales bacterium]|nr:hypothetical protein [Bacteroidales bacterium]